MRSRSGGSSRAIDHGPRLGRAGVQHRLPFRVAERRHHRGSRRGVVACGHSARRRDGIGRAAHLCVGATLATPHFPIHGGEPTGLRRTYPVLNACHPVAVIDPGQGHCACRGAASSRGDTRSQTNQWFSFHLYDWCHVNTELDGCPGRGVPVGSDGRGEGARRARSSGPTRRREFSSWREL